MPELPEVETVRQGLAPVLSGHRIVRVEQRRPALRFPLPPHFAERLEGRRVKRLDRRAKYILVHLDGGEVLAIHLGMTGRFTVSPARRGKRRQIGEFTHDHGQHAKHDHLIFTISGGAVVTYNDARRFGYMTLIPEKGLAQDPFFKGLGVEPLGPELTSDYLARRAQGRKADLKAFLMDQRIVAGLGNIYVCEALFRAGLDPWTPAARLATKSGRPTAKAGHLVAAIKGVLTDAIRAGGSTLRDYQQTNGDVGNFQHDFAVYGREGKPCARRGCRGTVRRKTQGGRSTFYCAACQR
ncbi:MAG TPA: bifunctional DNA-formamidopyrimidine glycosylase/DNA-(apurinic or apyrimidinic site) lyase [Hyphomicrobiaceae bacterium]|jgi:formamidopyrimidine-DNA glycosylase|nr:bifunctional DNA-formamidopyrimidine glycosylase/DNA-(apurinic or apyrimidinic site) lyase [Hyphomicrobiaceae bacterium]